MKTTILKVSLILAIAFLSLKSNAQAIFIGPMLHYNFGGENRSFSYGLEASFWGNIEPDGTAYKRIYRWPVGFDLGVEFEKGKKRLYTELQTGPLIGVSGGTVFEWEKEKPMRVGFQGSAWFALIGGVDARIRIFKDEKIFAPGVFVKVPLYFYGQEIIN